MSINYATPFVKPTRNYDRSTRRNKNMVLFDLGISYTEAVEVFSTTGEKIATLYTEEGSPAPTFINCRNCGAPVKGHKCEYCDTRY